MCVHAHVHTCAQVLITSNISKNVHIHQSRMPRAQYSLEIFNWI